MSDEAKPTQSPVRVDVGVKAEAKLEIKTEIPSESSGHLVDALVDIIRPFSEKRGLRADLIRLQREEVAVAIALKAAERLRISESTPHSIPNKILVPILEKASLEEPNSELIDWWANLLASTARSPNIKSVTFADVLSQIGGNHARLLDHIASPRWKVVPEPLLGQMGATRDTYRDPYWLARNYRMGIKTLIEKELIVPEIRWRNSLPERIPLVLLQQEIDERELCYTVGLGVGGTHIGDRYYRENRIDFDILERQSLIEGHTLEMPDLARNLFVTVYGMTELGIEFVYSISGPQATTTNLIASR